MKDINEKQINNFQSHMISKDEGEVVKLGDWMITLLITGIPVLGLIMLFVWAFSKGKNPSKRNWARANLIWIAISTVLVIILFGSILTFLSSMTKS